MDPTWPPQPLHMEPGGLKSRLPSSTIPKVSVRSRFCKKDFVSSTEMYYCAEFSCYFVFFLTIENKFQQTRKEWHLAKKLLYWNKLLLLNNSVGRKNNADVSWDPQDVRVIYAFMCITDGVSECLCWTLFSPTLASQSRRPNHSSKHPAQDWGHSPCAHQQDPQSVWTQMRNTWVLERSSWDTFSFRQKVWLLVSHWHHVNTGVVVPDVVYQRSCFL